MLKRTLIRAGIVVGAVAAAGAVGLAIARPDLVPARLRASLPFRAGAADAKCEAHGVPEKFCTLCHPELKQSLDLCEEHGGLPEDICTKCHPKAEAKHGLRMCPEGHGFPASFCPECREKAGAPTAARAEAPDDGWCVRHAAPEALCAECLKEGGPSDGCRKPWPVVHLAGPDIPATIGLETARSAVRRHAHTIEGVAEISYAVHDYAEVRPRVAGRVARVLVDEGDTVAEGQVLVVVDSAEVGTAKAQYLGLLPIVEVARATADRLTALRQGEAVAQKSLLEARGNLSKAEADLLNARQRLRNLGFTDADLAQIAKDRDTSSLLKVVSPLAGTLVERHSVVGEAVAADAQLFAVTDLTEMWCLIDVGEAQIPSIKVGQAARFVIAGTEGPAYEGPITLIGSAVDPKTRTIRVRAELANRDGRLRANQFGRAAIQVESEHGAVVVPRAAVQSDGKADLVFLPQGAAAYLPRRVLTRPIADPGLVEVTWGLKPGQEIVTAASFALKSELLKDDLGPGCCPE